MKITITALKVYEGEPVVYKEIEVIKEYTEQEVWDLIANGDIFDANAWKAHLSTMLYKGKPLPSHTPHGQRIAYTVVLQGYRKGMDERADSVRKGGGMHNLFPGWDWNTKQKRDTATFATLSDKPLPPYYYK